MMITSCSLMGFEFELNQSVGLKFKLVSGADS